MLVVIGELFIAASTYSDAWFWHTWGCLFQSLPCFLRNRWILNIRCMMNSLLVWTIFGRTIRNILGWFLRNWVHGSRACDRWCVKPWKSWMAFSCGGCANRKWTCVRNGPKWRICCFPRPSGMHAADFMCVPHTFGGDLTATLILLIFYCGSAWKVCWKRHAGFLRCRPFWCSQTTCCASRIDANAGSQHP